jgi:hypothetical protein
VKKAVAPIKKHRVPTVGVMAEVSLAESQKSSPQGRAKSLREGFYEKQGRTDFVRYPRSYFSAHAEVVC